MSIFRCKKNIYHFVKPNKLMLQYSFKLIKGNVKGSTLCWNIEGIKLTYLQMAELVKDYKLESGKIINNFTI